MRDIVHTLQVFLAILISLSLTCEGQQQGRPYFPNQQPQNVQNVVPRNNNYGGQNLQNAQQQYHPLVNPGAQQNFQQSQQKNYFFVNPANNVNQPAQLPQNQVPQNGQVYKRVGNLVQQINSDPNVKHFNQGNNEINSNAGTLVGDSKDIVNPRNEIQKEIKDNIKGGDSNIANTAKVLDVNKGHIIDSQVAEQGSLNQKTLETSVVKQDSNIEKPKNDSKSVFVINKNKFYGNDGVDKVNEIPQHNLNDQLKTRDAVHDKVNEPVENKQSGVNGADVVQSNKLPNEDLRYPIKSDVDKDGASDGQARLVGVHNLPVDIKINQPVDRNNNVPKSVQDNSPVDVNDPKKLNAAYKELSQNPNRGVPINLDIIDGEVEKKKGLNQISVDYDDGNDNDDDEEDNKEYDAGAGRSDVQIEKKETMSNEIPRDLGAPNNVNNPNRQDIQGPYNYGNQQNPGQQINDQQFQVVQPINRGQQMDDGQLRQSNENKEGSLKVVWDWSDFAVNFEQYIAPEQKIRRAPRATTGEPWPLPQYYVAKHDVIYRIDKSVFHFKLSKVKCDIIDKAIDRYKSYILEDSVEEMYDNFQHAQSTLYEDPTLKYETPTYTEAPTHALVAIKIRKPCAKLPSESMDESYDLFVKRTGIFLWANEVWGALRGLETFSQLVFKGPDRELYVKDTVINDYPRFSHRGVLIDSSRHFIFKETIFDALEGMAQNKMNVMHWHIVDDQSFPYQSKAYPDLSEKGAFHPSFVYTSEDIAEVIEFARLRGIRVEPEFDTPGHTYSWGLSRPDLLTQCYQGDRPVDGYLGPLDPSKNETFRFLKNFFKDVLHTFKDQYLHLGGDEVPMTCWSSNPEVLRLLAKLEGRPEPDSHRTDPYYYSYDIRKVLEFYVKRLMTDVKQVGVKRPNNVRFVFWQEIMNNDVQLPNDTIIQVWQGGMEEVQRATSLGLNVIYSTCWYLDLIEYGTKWSKYYHCDPVDTMYGYNIDESKVLGGEACLWAEYIDNENLMSMLWPRASAAAERLWSHKDVRDIDQAASRLQEHRCRMLSRGLGVGQISGPDYCLRRGKRHHTVNNTQSMNCTLAQCASFAEKGRVEIEKIKVEFQQKGGPISDCSQNLKAHRKGCQWTFDNIQEEINRYMNRSKAVLQAGGNISLIVLVLIIVIVGFTLKFTKKKIVQVRMCKNKTILLVFVTLILVYFMCYTSIWMQALQFKGSFEKRISSNIDDKHS